MTQGFAVEVGTVSTRKGAALHARGCGWSRFLPVITTVVLTKKNARRVCKNCRTAVRAAIETARDLNNERTASSHSIVMDKIAVESRLVVLVDLFPTKAEMVRDAELIARYTNPMYASSGFSGAVFTPKPVVEVEPDLLSLIPSRPKSAFAEAVERMGVRSPKPSIRRSKATRRNVNIHARFATKAA